MTHLNLANPAMCYRPIPFWSWNDALDPEELRRQVREMHEQGLGGFFMHARGGLQTEYLSDAWMDCVKACCDEAGKVGMGAWLYDENGWPSGFGGGLVNGLGEDYQQKYLRFEVVEAKTARSLTHTIGFYSEDGTRFLGRELPGDAEGAVLRAYYLVNPFYVDNLDAKVVAEFIRVTHQHYYDSLPEELRAHLRGIFTDEPQLSRNGLLWSFVLEDAYRREYDRELLPELPSLGYDCPGAPGVRVRFWRLCAKLFRDHFLRQIHDWCDAHGWLLTGHHVLEETCEAQLTSNGSVMAQYQYYHIPGVDHLCRTVPNCVMLTQLASTAAQCGLRQQLTESFALTGWNCNFSGQRFIFQPELAHGINLLCQHLEGYSLRGLRKRDYPSSAFYHQPWWHDYKVMNDYFSRIGQIMAEGRQRVRTLVIHPESTAWMRFRGEKGEPLSAYCSESLKRLTQELDARQIAHHYADELICEEQGSCDSGLLHVGKCSYSLVVIPPLMNLSSRLYELLRVFQLAGGRIFRLANEWEDRGVFSLDGEPACGDACSWFRSLPEFADEKTAAEKIASLYPDRVILQENGEPTTTLVSTCREVDDLDGRGGLVHFIVHEDYQGGRMVHVSLPATGAQVEVIDAVTGSFRLLRGVELKDGRFEFDYYFGGADAALFFVPVSPVAYAYADDTRQLMQSPARKNLPASMELTVCDDNLLTLDHCRYRVEGGAWEEADIISLQSRLVVLKRPVQVEMELDFAVSDDFDLETPLAVLVETPGLFSFTLNGVPFSAQDAGYVFDRAFRRLPLPSQLRHGRNILGLSLLYRQPEALYGKLEAARQFETERNKLTFETEIESVYLIGKFGVRHVGEVESLDRDAVRCNGRFEVCPSPVGTSVNAADLVCGGLPFFSGKAVLESRFQLTAEEASSLRALRFAPHGANGWKLTLNGQSLGPCFWEPYVVSVSGKLQPGTNVLTMELTTSLRNTLGPHHLAEGESYAVTTVSFNREADFVGHGAPKTVDGYCLVRLGVEQVELM